MTITVDFIKSNSKFIGHFSIEKYKMPFTRVDGIRRKDLIALGDVVYFMFVNDQLMKIGKAGGKGGFAGRANTYMQGRYGDATNRRIMDVMDKIGETHIDVYCVQSPKKVIEYNCPLTGEVITEEVSTHKNVELRLTHKYLAEDVNNELAFCNQLN
jgi:hypothetical protein